ncbi:MAG TPA: hypothetical protein PLJ08_08915, partial [Cyclobacteriaceae bacterium]|nr:hypothetical protein [Cyclobacteriaceae bacterium]
SSRSDIRGQSFRPASQGSGTGTITTAESFVFLHSIAVIFSGGVAPSTLYVYGTLAPSTTELDNGSYGNLVTQSTSKTTDFPYTIYHFNEAPILKEGRYYALFRQDVQLEFGASANNIGPYNGGSMITNDGNAPIAN